MTKFPAMPSANSDKMTNRPNLLSKLTDARFKEVKLSKSSTRLAKHKNISKVLCTIQQNKSVTSIVTTAPGQTSITESNRFVNPPELKKLLLRNRSSFFNIHIKHTGISRSISKETHSAEFHVRNIDTQELLSACVQIQFFFGLFYTSLSALGKQETNSAQNFVCLN